MAKLLFAGTHGVEDPTKAGLVFLATKGGKEAGHNVAVALMGDATILMNQTIRESVLPVGIPPLKDLFQFVIENRIPVYIWGACGKARGVSENDFKGIQAEWMDPKKFASLVAEYDRTVTI